MRPINRTVFNLFELAHKESQRKNDVHVIHWSKYNGRCFGSKHILHSSAVQKSYFYSISCLTKQHDSPFLRASRTSVIVSGKVFVF